MRCWRSESLEFRGQLGKPDAQCLVLWKKTFFPVDRALGHLAEGIHGLKQVIDHFLGQGDGVVAAMIQQIFNIVEESRESLELQQRSVALDGVRRAEQRGNQLAVFRVGLQRQERLLHLREAFLGLFAERLQQQFSIDFHYSPTKP